jgi:hypothetical protein
LDAPIDGGRIIGDRDPATGPTPAPDPIEGVWCGSVTAPQGQAEIGFKFERTTVGRLVYALYFPIMNTYGARFEAPVMREGDRYSEPVFQSQLRMRGDKITGTFGPGRLPLALACDDRCLYVARFDGDLIAFPLH